MMYIKNLLVYIFLLFYSLTVAQSVNLKLANEELNELAIKKQYASKDIGVPIVTDEYTSKGITHIYYQQTVDQIGIYGSNAAVHIKDGAIFSSNINFLKGIEKRNIKKEFRVQALAAVTQLASAKNYPLSQTELLILESDDADPAQSTIINNAGISNRTIPLKLVFIEDEQQSLQLAWSVFIDEVDGANYKHFLINATTGVIEKEINLTINCAFEHDHSSHEDETTFLTGNPLNNLLTIHQAATIAEERLNIANSYNVYPLPIESPHFGDRSIVSSPWTANTIASPNGWHKIDNTSYTTTKGNNVDAYEDSDRTNNPTNGDADRTDGGTTLDFNNPLDLNGPVPDYKKAAITNLFYWNNITHDIWYNYGFDEPSGNFQEENFDRGGVGGDYVYAEAQDGLGTCNANFSPLIDGENPRMQMFKCGDRDGDFDNVVIVHEYGHGISNRLTGGPADSECLKNDEQMGEGWSDWFGVVMTIQAGDVAETPRTIGTWLFEEESDGPGIRPYPYSTNMTINPMTYDNLSDDGISVPHGVGSIWATMLWDLTWSMIDSYGWDPDQYNGTGGNNKMMALVIEGLKIQPCSPGFIDGRDAILAADRLLYGGDHQCLIWKTFARRGLGFSASQGATSSRIDGKAAFDLPPSCTITLEKITDKQDAHLGEEISYTLRAVNKKGFLLENLVFTDFLPDNLEFVSASFGGQANGKAVTWPMIQLESGETAERHIIAKVRNDLVKPDSIFRDNFEEQPSNWSITSGGTGNWVLQSDQVNSGNIAYHATGGTPAHETNLTLVPAKSLTTTSELIFQHYYDIESGEDASGSPRGWDAGVVQISTNNGGTWADLGDKMTQNGYNLPTFYNFDGFSGKSNGWLETKVDLSEYANSRVIIRFQMRHDFSISKEGWYIDDVQITNLNELLFNEAQISNSTITASAVSQATNIIFQTTNTCIQDLITDFNNPAIPTNEYRGNYNIISAGGVKNGSDVGFYAENSIVLDIGFHVETGSKFIAAIEDCPEEGSENSLKEEAATQKRLNVATTPIRYENNIAVYPNPFSHQANIHYQLSTNGPLWIGLHDFTGKVVKILHSQSSSSIGNYQLNLDSRQLENGAYWLTMRTQHDVLTTKVFIIKN